MNAMLNEHMMRRFEGAEACELWTIAGLRSVLESLHPHISPELGAIYESTRDRRDSASSRPSTSLQFHQAQLHELETAAVAAGDVAQDILRDALCIEAAMWLAHHVPASAADVLPNNVPLLPRKPRARSEMIVRSNSSDSIWKKYQ